MKIKFLVIFVLLGFLSIFLFPSRSEKKKDSTDHSNLSSKNQLSYKAETNELVSIPPKAQQKPSKVKNQDSKETEILLAALPTLEVIRKSKGLQPQHHLKSTIYSSPLGHTIRYDVYDDNIPIIGFEMMIEMDRNLSVQKHQSHVMPVGKVNMDNLLSYRDIASRLANDNLTPMKEPPLVLYFDSNGGQLEPAFTLNLSPSHHHSPTSMVVSARDGRILKQSFPRRD